MTSPPGNVCQRSMRTPSCPASLTTYCGTCKDTRYHDYGLRYYDERQTLA